MWERDREQGNDMHKIIDWESLTGHHIHCENLSEIKEET